MKDKIFGVLQRVGRSFMLPIALLPVAGLLLGIGSSFTNATMLEAYGLTSVIYPGSVLYTVLDIMNQCGSAVFDNLALLFAMYIVHCVYAGLSYMLMHIFNVGVGMTFSGGLIDLTLFGILQGNAKTHWIWIVVVGVVFFFLYYFTFRVMITKMNLATPGRESDDVEPKLYTRSDFKEKTGIGPDGAGKASDPVSALILQGLGGKKNISDVDCCATRLRITVVDEGKVDVKLLNASGASGVIHKGNGIQALASGEVQSGTDLLSIE